METLLAGMLNIPMSTGWGVVFASVIVPLLVFCRSLPGKLFNRLRMMLTIVLIIDETDNMAGTKTFQSLNVWLCENRVQWLTRIFEVNGIQQIVAGIGFNVFYYKRSLFWCTMGRKEPTSNFSKIKAIGTYNIYTFKWNKDILQDFVEDSCKPTTTDFKGCIYRGGADVNYVSDFPVYMKNQKQLISNNTYQQIDEIFKRFTSDPQAYYDRSRPHKETILLYGPPGTGKTNLSLHLAAKYNMDLITISPEDLYLDSFVKKSWDARYFKGLTVFLVEDIDSNKSYLDGQEESQDSQIIVKTDSTDASTAKGGTLSCLLNALDGASPLDRCIVILSTNYPQKLKEAIYREGRVDHRILMDYISYKDALAYLDWDEEDTLSKVLKSHSSNRLHAATISKLKFANTEEEVITILTGGELSKSLKHYS